MKKRNELIRAVTVEDGRVRFVLEVEAAKGAAMEPVRAAAVQALERIAAELGIKPALQLNGISYYSVLDVERIGKGHSRTEGQREYGAADQAVPAPMRFLFRSFIL